LKVLDFTTGFPPEFIPAQARDGNDINFLSKNLLILKLYWYKTGVKLYTGITQSLLGFACKVSVEGGFNGEVVFESKTKLISYYETVFNATRIGSSQRLFIDEETALKLIQEWL
jgi:hypothetical protein